MMQQHLQRRAETLRIGLPRTFFIAVADEVRRVISPPYEVPLVMVFNAALVILAWELLPRNANELIFRYQDRHALPAALAVWMVATVASTNLIGPDVQRMLWALDRPSAMGRMLRAKGFVVWLLLVPVVGAVDLSYGFKEGDAMVAILRTGMLVCVPLAAVGFGSWIGVLLPYKPIALRERLTDLKARPKRTLRWLLCLLLPYVVMPVIGWLLLVPVIEFGLRTKSGRLQAQRIDHYGTVFAAFLAIASGLGFILLATRVAVARIAKHPARIAALLNDPERG